MPRRALRLCWRWCSAAVNGVGTEYEMSRTQKNKATEYHLGLLKAKLAKLRSELLTGSKGGGGKGEGFDVAKSGDGRVALIGFPSVGKSTLLSTLTHTESAVAAYEFTTLTWCVILEKLLPPASQHAAYPPPLLSQYPWQRDVQRVQNPAAGPPRHH
jgi:hypothetical protein